MTATNNSFRPTPTLLLLSSLLISTQAFHAVKSTRIVTTSSTSSQPLKALIYGWDGQEEDYDTTSTTTTSSASYLDIGNDPFNSKTCSPMGTAVAEALSYDRDRAGHLARLAVAFASPDQALTLDKIEKVDVLCVHDDSIDIQAILCEHHGCVSLSVPIQFPKACYSNSPELEGCVIQNLDALDETAGSVLQGLDQAASLNNAEQLGGDFNAPFDSFPNWWIPPESYPNVAYDCQTIQNLLNEDEFQSDVNALAQEALKRIEQCQDYKVLQARVAKVGPAGICFKVRAQEEYVSGGPVRILEVVHPFDETWKDSEALRAAVLGAVAAV